MMDRIQANLLKSISQTHWGCRQEDPRRQCKWNEWNNIFCLWQHSRSQKTYSKKFKTIKMSSATGRINDNQKSVFLKAESQYYLTQVHDTKTNTNERVDSGASFPFFICLKLSQKGSHLLDIKSAMERKEGKRTHRWIWNLVYFCKLYVFPLNNPTLAMM